jgi:thiamine biosynthesis lipoprotein
MMLGMMIVLTTLEHVFVAAVLPPHVKPGLANIIVMYCVFTEGHRQAFFLNCLKSLFVLITRGVVAGLLSLSGGILSLVVIVLLAGVKKKQIGYAAVSVAGALAHNMGQFIVVIFLLSTPLMIFYLPVLLIAAVVAGLVTGALLKALMPAFEKLKKSGLFLLLILLFFTSCSTEAEERRFQVQQLGYFDSFVIFVGYAQNEADFSRFADILFDKLGTLHRLYDIFNSYEGVNNLYEVNAKAGIAPVVVDREIIDLLLAAVEAYRLTDGAVNIAMGAVLRIWHEHRQKEMLPCMQALNAAAQLSDIDDLIIDTENNTVFLRRAGMSLDVGSIAKGFAAELAMQTLREAEMKAALLNIGGHVLAYGKPPEREGWEVGIRHQTDTLFFTDATLSVSGGYERFFEAEGIRFGHIIDPATLMPANRFMQVAVLHLCSWTADILSTALFILPKEEGLRLALENGAQAFWNE